MRRLLHLLATLSFVAGAATATAAATPAAAPAPKAPAIQLPQPPDIAAPSYLVMDVNSGQILAGKDIDSPVEPASLTKLMTAYVVFDALRTKKITLTQTLPISEQAWKAPGSRMFVQVDTQVPVEDLIKGMIVQSGNDAAVALAEGVGGTVQHFVELMNEQAQALGMKNTSYKNPDGLPEAGHVTTARDLATLTAHLLKDFPEDSKYFAIKKYLYPGTPKSNDTNRNRMLFLDPTVDGMKTGHTQAAGYCQVTTAKRDFPNLKGRQIIAVLLHANSDRERTSDSQKLLNWGYTAYEDVQLFAADAPAASPRVWKGTASELKLGRLNGPIVVSVPAGQAKQIKTEIARPDPLIAPYKKGQTVATLKVSLDDQALAEVPLVVLQDVPEAGFFSRVWDAIRLWIHAKV
jgi:D-alanyl-D-alanine carboxypeptidase (penicillin-binding protein 5/6)